MRVLPNGVAVIDGCSHHGVWCATEGLVHDRFMAGIIQDVIRRRHVKVAVDGGSNIGTLTRVMLDDGAEVHAFECNPEALACLRHNCPQARIHPTGLGREMATFPFKRLENAGASHIDIHDKESREFITVVALDSFDIKPGFIKLDVEGFEVSAIQGARRIIEENRPVMLIEVNAGALMRAGTSDGELLELLDSLNYKIEIAQPDCQFGDPQYDVLAFPL